jgi:hypothetical protein
MTPCASAGLFQNSAAALRSSSSFIRASLLATSKPPPEMSHDVGHLGQAVK